MARKQYSEGASLPISRVPAYLMEEGAGQLPPQVYAEILRTQAAQSNKGKTPITGDKVPTSDWVIAERMAQVPLAQQKDYAIRGTTESGTPYQETMDWKGAGGKPLQTISFGKEDITAKKKKGGAAEKLKAALDKKQKQTGKNTISLKEIQEATQAWKDGNISNEQFDEFNNRLAKQDLEKEQEAIGSREKTNKPAFTYTPEELSIYAQKAKDTGQIPPNVLVTGINAPGEDSPPGTGKRNRPGGPPAEPFKGELYPGMDIGSLSDNVDVNALKWAKDSEVDPKTGDTSIKSIDPLKFLNDIPEDPLDPDSALNFRTRLQDAINKDKDALGDSMGKVQAMTNYEQGLDILPTVMLVDQRTGSNFAPRYKAPIDRVALKMALENHAFERKKFTDSMAWQKEKFNRTMAVKKNQKVLQDKYDILNTQLRAAGLAPLSGKQLSPSFVMKLTKTKTALNELQKTMKFIHSNPELMGIEAGIKGRLSYGKYFPEYGRMRSKVMSLIQELGKSKEDGILKDADWVKYKEMMPSEFINPRPALQRYSDIYHQIVSDLKERMRALEVTGYAVQPLSSLLDQQVTEFKGTKLGTQVFSDKPDFFGTKKKKGPIKPTKGTKFKNVSTNFDVMSLNQKLDEMVGPEDVDWVEDKLKKLPNQVKEKWEAFKQ